MSVLLRKLLPSASFNLTEVMAVDASEGAVSAVEFSADLASLEDVAGLEPAFRSLKVDWIGADAAVTACVAEMDNGYAVFVKRGHLDTDICRAVQQRARIENHKRAQQTLRVYSVAPVVLLALVRERMDHRAVQQGVACSGGRSAVRTGFHDIVAWAVRQGASDLHLDIDENSPISRVSVHIDGQYVTPSNLSMPTERMMEMLRVAWLDVRGGKGAVFDPTAEQQGRIYEVVDDVSYMLRLASFITDSGPSVTFRLLDLTRQADAGGLDRLGYLPSQIAQFERAMQSQGGGIVLAGVPGSGKTRTIGQLLAGLPATRKLMSIEDPVELRIAHALQGSITRSLDGVDNDAFRAKIMALKRSAASDVLLGEIRDTLSGAAFQDIVQSGSNGYTTVHGGSALLIPQRLASAQIGITADVLGSPRFLKLLCYQTLMPTLCQCALPVGSLLTGGGDYMGLWRDGAWWHAYLARMERLYHIDGVRLKIRNIEGCSHCQRKGLPELYGYHGRTVVAEIFEPSDDLDVLAAITRSDTLRLHAIYTSARTAAFDDPNMEGKSAMQCAVYKATQGVIDPRDIEPHFMTYASVARSQSNGGCERRARS